ncbi:PKD domain-containing protein [Foetidibacter luteolus]|uniref:PKD domain-containing protein n=1 Tax=Foetidibacter luteolus TaxID=2608880 RepID=UPI00129A62CB|nr:PKD domain-containing protein [Foetidibacter luteolus]
MKKIVLLALFATLLFTKDAIASHIVGGEVFYEYLGPGAEPNTSRYKVSLRLFRDCLVTCGVNQVACLPSAAIVGIFSNSGSYERWGNVTVNIDSTTSVSANYPVCISTRPPTCYEVKTYSAFVELPDNDEGYILAYQNCCRASSANVLDNAPSISGVPGATYDCIMPGRDLLGAATNSSGVFKVQNAELVCYNTNFVLDFSATDPDGDSLSYAFSAAYNGGAFTSAQDANPPGDPNYGSVSYNTGNGFSGNFPLGLQAAINPVTGIISGISPNVGRYVVNVVVYEWRNGIIIGRHRKDFIMRVENCTIPQAALDPNYLTCDGFNLTFQNTSTAANINSYFWDFGIDTTLADTSTSPIADYSFPDSGTYTITLITNKGEACSDTAYAVAQVYPGFVADFTINGSCYQKPFEFTDASTFRYGRISGWRWDFGDLSTLADTSLLQHPSYAYADSGTRYVSLTVTNERGCTDDTTKLIQVTDKPAYNLPFKDTLICSIDTLQLQVNTTGAVAWQPDNSNIMLNANTNTPLVFPKTGTWFTVRITEAGCVADDSVRVNVIDNVTIDIGPDTTICLTDSIQFFPQTNALYFAWTPSATMRDTTVKNAVATPISQQNDYHVVASVGKCSNQDDITIFTAPYPVARAFGDTTICYGDFAQLRGETDGENYSWSPAILLRDANTLTPRAVPNTTVNYVLTAYNTSGCLKPVTDTVRVVVIPPVQANAGRDTMIVVNQPLQLNATGGNAYQWSPTFGMNNPNIADPIVTLNSFYDTVTYKVRVSIVPPGCFAEDEIRVVIFKTLPDIFVPSAFTPNSDGRNDIVKPIVVGMQKFNYFRVFNRWGQMLYQTSTIGMGWNGMYAGQEQPSGTYVYMAQAVDYEGRTVNRKGTIVLIR